MQKNVGVVQPIKVHLRFLDQLKCSSTNIKGNVAILGLIHKVLSRKQC